MPTLYTDYFSGNPPGSGTGGFIYDGTNVDNGNPIGIAGLPLGQNQDLLCPKINQSLYNVASENVGIFYRQQIGFLDSLMSQRNTRGFNPIPSYGPNGGARRLDFIYQQAFSDGANLIDLTGQYRDICVDAPAQDVVLSQNIDPSVFAAASSAIHVMTLAEMKHFCSESADEYRATVMAGMFNSILPGIDLALIQNFYNPTPPPFIFGTPGNYWGTGASTAAIVNLVDPNGIVYIGGWSRVKEEFHKMGFSQPPIVVGGYGLGSTGIQTFADLSRIGCCNQYGVDINGMNNVMDFYYDNYMDNSGIPGLPIGSFLAYQPGSLQFLNWNENVGYGAINMPDEVRGIVIDPITGIPFDFFAKYKSCASTTLLTNPGPYWELMIAVRFGLWGYPVDMYAGPYAAGPPINNPMDGVTHNLTFQAV